MFASVMLPPTLVPVRHRMRAPSFELFYGSFLIRQDPLVQILERIGRKVQVRPKEEGPVLAQRHCGRVVVADYDLDRQSQRGVPFVNRVLPTAFSRGVNLRT